MKNVCDLCKEVRMSTVTGAAGSGSQPSGMASQGSRFLFMYDKNPQNSVKKYSILKKKGEKEREISVEEQQRVWWSGRRPAVTHGA